MKRKNEEGRKEKLNVIMGFRVSPILAEEIKEEMAKKGFQKISSFLRWIVHSKIKELKSRHSVNFQKFSE